MTAERVISFICISLIHMHSNIFVFIDCLYEVERLLVIHGCSDLLMHQCCQGFQQATTFVFFTPSNCNIPEFLESE